MPYNFAYAVKDDDYYVDYGHSETSDGKVVSGSYNVVLPDGRRQVVTYKDEGYGYVADVAYEGEAKPYEYKPAYPKAYPGIIINWKSINLCNIQLIFYISAPAYPSYAPKAYPGTFKSI